MKILFILLILCSYFAQSEVFHESARSSSPFPLSALEVKGNEFKAIEKATRKCVKNFNLSCSLQTSYTDSTGSASLIDNLLESSDGKSYVVKSKTIIQSIDEVLRDGGFIEKRYGKFETKKFDYRLSELELNGVMQEVLVKVLGECHKAGSHFCTFSSLNNFSFFQKNHKVFDPDLGVYKYVTSVEVLLNGYILL